MNRNICLDIGVDDNTRTILIEKMKKDGYVHLETIRVPGKKEGRPCDILVFIPMKDES